mmetsp:Transcript_6758/g.17703  ORF Transcript_6758/g.17703 Transcript_6758/m.17703 type:complete len:304 (-) Transcript_6758:178-1089(-)
MPARSCAASSPPRRSSCCRCVSADARSRFAVRSGQSGPLLSSGASSGRLPLCFECGCCERGARCPARDAQRQQCKAPWASTNNAAPTGISMKYSHVVQRAPSGVGELRTTVGMNALNASVTCCAGGRSAASLHRLPSPAGCDRVHGASGAHGASPTVTSSLLPACSGSGMVAADGAAVSSSPAAAAAPTSTIEGSGVKLGQASRCCSGLFSTTLLAGGLSNGVAVAPTTPASASRCRSGSISITFAAGSCGPASNEMAVDDSAPARPAASSCSGSTPITLVAGCCGPTSNEETVDASAPAAPS